MHGVRIPETPLAVNTTIGLRDSGFLLGVMIGYARFNPTGGHCPMSLGKHLFGLVLLVAVTSTLFAVPQQSAKQDVKDAGHDTKQAAKDAGHGTQEAAKDVGHGTKQAATHTGRAVKTGTRKTGHQIKKTSKSAAHKTAHTTKKGAQKVEDKTQPNP
jgi:hypothetical protein